jgi:soluble lytic murein transglycosylase-like protein
MGIRSLLLLIIVLTSCAGPTTPFGGDIFISESFDIKKTSSSFLTKTIKFDFFPERQYYNSPYNLSIKIQDPNFDLTKFKYEIIYNHKKLNRWLKSETIILPETKEDPIEIVFNNLSILPGNINEIAFLYYPSDSDSPVVHKLKVPECFKNPLSKSFLSLSPFNIKKDLKSFINTKSREYNYNPSLIAALIAQESSFNNTAISKAWALGLTQVTPIAHREIKQVKKDWEIFPNFSKLPLKTIRSYLKDNTINENNDWRLNPNRSIEGGIIYLDYLTSYWKTPDKQEILHKAFEENIPEVDILLASYNSGAYRVKKSIQENGTEWLTKKNLHEARKYVMNIKSYCFSFNQGSQHEK